MNEDALSRREEVLSMLDEYESLLSPKQADVLAKYYRYDLSLSEIAEEESISRTAVYDGLRKGIKKLESLEKKLRLAYIKASLLEAHMKQEDGEKLSSYEALCEEVTHGV